MLLSLTVSIWSFAKLNTISCCIFKIEFTFNVYFYYRISLFINQAVDFYAKIWFLSEFKSCETPAKPVRENSSGSCDGRFDFALGNLTLLYNK